MVNDNNNRNPTPEEWRAATDYALTLSEKMVKASEKRAEDNKYDQQRAKSAAK